MLGFHNICIDKKIILATINIAGVFTARAVGSWYPPLPNIETLLLIEL